MKKEYFKPEVLVINVNTTQTSMTSIDIDDAIEVDEENVI